MTDVEFTTFQTIMAFLGTLVNAGCLTALFLQNANDNRKSKKYAGCGCIYICYIILSFIGMRLPYFGLWGVVIVIFSSGLLAPVLGLNRYFSMFLAILFFCLDRAVGLMGNSVLYVLNKKLTCGMELEAALQRTAYNYIFVDLMQAALLVAVICLIGRKILPAPLELHVREWGYLCIIPVIGIVFGELVVRLLFVEKEQVVFGIYDEYPAFLVWIPMVCVLFCAGSFFTILSYQKMMRLRDERKTYFVMTQQMRAMQERMRETECMFDELRKMRHDIRNHLTNIKGLAENGHYADISPYISKMNVGLGTFSLAVKTGNPVLDVIVSDKFQMAQSGNITFRSEFSFPSSENFDAYDIGVIVNNLLTNAIEACENMKGGDRYITLTGGRKKRFFIIEVTNSYEGEVRFHPATNLPVSTKPNPDLLHGIGLSNVREQARGYGGDLDIRADGKEFCVTVLLQEK